MITFVAAFLATVVPAFASEDEPREPVREAVVTENEPIQLLRPENRSIEGLVIEVRDDGIMKVDLEGRFMHAMAVRIEEDGTSVFECLDDADAMHRFLHRLPETPAQKQETADR